MVFFFIVAKIVYLEFTLLFHVGLPFLLHNLPVEEVEEILSDYEA